MTSDYFYYNRIRQRAWWVALLIFFTATWLIGIVGCNSSNTTTGTKAGRGDHDTGVARAKFRTTEGKKMLQLPWYGPGPTTLDPAGAMTPADQRCNSQIYEPLLQYKYLSRPLELEPLLLTKLPTVSNDGTTWHFQLKPNIRFHDDACFADGKGRELVADDVIYSWQRLADPSVAGNNGRIFDGVMVGFNAAAASDGIAGLKKINSHEFMVTLTEPSPQFIWSLANSVTAIVPREAVEKLGSQFASHPVGTGPFMVAPSDWARKSSITMKRNPNYHQSDNLDSSTGGENAPVEQIETIFYQDSQAMWLEFRTRKLSLIAVPATVFEEVFEQQSLPELKASFVAEGISHQPVPLLDLIYIGFNMDDKIVGGYSEEKRNLRRAMASAIDWSARDRNFYNGSCLIYDGVIPPGLAGYPVDGKMSNSPRGLDLEHAKSLLAAAGYPAGKKLPPLDFYSVDGFQSDEMAELTKANLAAIGVPIKTHLSDFETFIKRIEQGQAQLFGFSWLSDYPDAENNLSLFYSRNVATGRNRFHYSNPEFDRLYEQIRSMPDGEQRMRLCAEANRLVLSDCPLAGSMARVRHYLVNPELKNFHASEQFQNWYKYLDVE